MEALQRRKALQGLVYVWRQREKGMRLWRWSRKGNAHGHRHGEPLLAGELVQLLAPITSIP